MKFNWLQRKLTFIIIPDDAGGTVVRLRLPRLLLAVAGMMLLGVLGFAVSIYSLHRHSAAETGHLTVVMSGKTAEYDRTLAEKEGELQKLQNEVVALSQQAKNVKQQIDGMKQLEDDVRSISQLGNAHEADATALKDGHDETAVGGAEIPATNEDILRLSADTKSDFDSITGEVRSVREGLTAVKEEVRQKQQQLRITPTLWPTVSHRITSGYGYRIDPFTRRPSFHSGIDFSGPAGTPVYTTADGVVTLTGSDSAHGNNIIVNHSNGIRTRYLHLSKILVSEGDKVQKGGKIGLIGNTGRSTGPHLHYEVIVNGRTVDPMPYLK